MTGRKLVVVVVVVVSAGEREEGEEERQWLGESQVWWCWYGEVHPQSRQDVSPCGLHSW